MYTKRLLLLITCLIAAWQMQSQQLSYRHFTTDDGLPSSEVYDVFQDSRGFIWMATDHGLSRFDGYNFKTFNTDNGLPDNTVFRIQEDTKGLLWVQTFSKGLYSFDGVQFKPHPRNDWILNRLSKKGLHNYDLVGDTLILNNLASVFGTTYNTAFDLWGAPDPYLLNRDTLFLTYAINNQNQVIYTLSQDKCGIINLPENRIYGTTRIQQKDDFKATADLSLLPDDKIAFSSGFSLFIFKAKADFALPVRTFDNRIIRVYASPSGPIWIGQFQGGVTKREWLKGKWVDKNYFGNYSITDVLEDREGNHWFTTLEDGVFFVPGINFQKMSPDAKDESALQVKMLSLKAGDKMLYAGGDKHYAYRIDSVHNLVTLDEREYEARIEDITIIGGEPVTSSHLGRINFNQSCFSNPLGMDTMPGGFIAVGGHQGFSIIQNNKVVYCSTSDNFKLRVPVVYYKPDLGLLLGTNEGVYLFNNSTYNYLFKDSLLHDIRITDIKSSPDGWLVIASRGKGVVFSKGKKRIEVSEKDGLVSNLTECIYVESDSSFWIGSYSGLSHVRFNPDTKGATPQFSNYTKKDGLSSNEINDIDFFKGEIWLGTNSGLCHFKPEEVAKHIKGFPIYLTSVTINGLPGMESDLLHLKHDQNNIILEMTGLDYKALNEITYNYTVEGKSRFSGSSRFRRISFFAMEPGDYTVRISAKSVIGDTSLAPYVIKFTIPKHYTQTAWFAGMLIFAVLLIAITIVYLFYQNQRIKIETRFQVMEAEQAALRSQMNPHFIFNVLNSIQAFLGENDRKQAQNFLGKFSQLIRRILENSKHGFITLEEEIKSLRLYLQLEQMRFEDKVSYNIEVDMGIEEHKVRVPPMMIQPMIENAILHGIAPSGKNGTIDVKFRIQNDNLVCTVRDNGVGLHAKKPSTSGLHKSTAIDNLQKRMELLNRLYNTHGSVEIHELYEDNMTIGTEAKLIFPLNF